MGTAATNSASRDVGRGAVSALGPFGCGTAATNAASFEDDDDGVTTGAAGGEGGATAVGVPEGFVASPRHAAHSTTRTYVWRQYRKRSRARPPTRTRPSAHWSASGRLRRTKASWCLLVVARFDTFRAW